MKGNEKEEKQLPLSPSISRSQSINYSNRSAARSNIKSSNRPTWVQRALPDGQKAEKQLEDPRLRRRRATETRKIEFTSILNVLRRVCSLFEKTMMIIIIHLRQYQNIFFWLERDRWEERLREITYVIVAVKWWLTLTNRTINTHWRHHYTPASS